MTEKINNVVSYIRTFIRAVLLGAAAAIVVYSIGIALAAEPDHPVPAPGGTHDCRLSRHSSGPQ